MRIKSGWRLKANDLPQSPSYSQQNPLPLHGSVIVVWVKGQSVGVIQVNLFVKRIECLEYRLAWYLSQTSSLALLRFNLIGVGNVRLMTSMRHEKVETWAV